MKKFKVLKKSILSLFVAIFMFMPFVNGISVSASTVMSSNELEEALAITDNAQASEEEINEALDSLNEENSGGARSLSLTAILALAKALFGKAIVAALATVIANVGIRAACRQYNDRNGAWDFVCDAKNQYKD